MTATPSNQRQPPTPEQLAEADALGYLSGTSLEQFTCFGCAAKATCSYAWDVYNTHGDCLADK